MAVTLSGREAAAKRGQKRGMRHLPALALLLILTALAWWLPNREQAGDVPLATDRFNSVSFAPFRPGQSPLRDIFPSAAEVEADMALVAPRVRAIRTYAAIGGDYDIAAIAARHGLKLWAGAWLGRDARQNAAELATLIEIANRHPETVERVVVGNEELLRRDLSPAALIAALDRVKAAVAQPVTYADVWEFWEQFPEVARHVDVITIHILPYWEDAPTDVEGSMAHARAVLARMRALFPGKPIAIGEVGWPSRGRWRAGAAPSRVQQAVFLRRFIALAEAEKLDYNLIEAFDQGWKYKSEGTVGAAWGLWTEAREAKFPLRGPVRENPYWGWYAATAALLGLGFWAAAGRAMPWLGFALGNALVFAWCGTVPYAFDIPLALAAAVNLAGQGALAGLLLWRVALGKPASASIPAACEGSGGALWRLRAALRGRLDWQGWRGWAFEDLCLWFLFTAMVLQLLLVFDPRYRDFPLAAFAVPLVVVAVRAWRGDWPARAEGFLGGTLVLAAMAGAVLEGPANLQALGWSACALLLAAPGLVPWSLSWRNIPRATGRSRPAGP